DEREDTLGREAQNAAPAVENRLAAVMAEADPVLDAPFEPGQLHVCVQRPGIGARRAPGVLIGSHRRPPSVSGNSRASRPRGMSATATPRWMAAILMRPRSAGAMSKVSRAV